MTWKDQINIKQFKKKIETYTKTYETLLKEKCEELDVTEDDIREDYYEDYVTEEDRYIGNYLLGRVESYRKIATMWENYDL